MPGTTSPSGSSSSAPAAAGSVAGLPGWLYYADFSRVVRLAATGARTVLTGGSDSATVSPDGTHIAFVDHNNDVVIADRDGQHRRTVLHGSVQAGYEPAWSPDSQQLLVAKGHAGGNVTLGIVNIAAGTFAALPHQFEAIHPLWTADGQHLGYATGTCQIGTADRDGSHARLVPVFGDLHNPANRQQRRSCDPYSISADGRLIAVNQRTGDQPDGDIGRDLYANAVIDTRTGANVALPVTGTISAVLFQPNGDILVRSTTKNTTLLTLLNPEHHIKAQVHEPATVNTLHLLAYTPN